MMTAPHQLTLFDLPRRLERGEHGCCLDCGEGGDGTYGPPGLDEVTLADGQGHTVDLPDQWLCARHSNVRWADYRRCLDLLAARRERLRAFRIAEKRGLRGSVLWTVAETWIRNGSVPAEDPWQRTR